MPNSQSNQPRRTLLLTGASRGIGHATVKRFSAAGWRVITCSRHPFPENCPWEMGPEDHIQVDLADAANTDARHRRDQAAAGHDGELHALVNNAAISPKADGGKRLCSLDTTQRRLAPRVSGEFLRADHAGARADRRAQGRQGLGGQRHLDCRLARASVRGRGLLDIEGGARRADPRDGRRLRPLGIRVNAIAPGEIDTAILSPGTEKIVEQIPLQRLGTPDEVAKIIYVLCTETSSYVNGAEIHINGGQHV